MRKELAKVIFTVECEGKEVITGKDFKEEIMQMPDDCELWHRDVIVNDWNGEEMSILTDKNVFIIHYCDKCNATMDKRMRYIPGTQTDDNPFGTKEYYYFCEDCGYEEGEE